MRKTGWVAPTLKQTVRALRSASPEAGDVLCNGVTPATSADLSANTTPLDQQDLGACTAHGIAQAFWMALVKAGLAPFVLARLALYYNERGLEGTTDRDVGANIGDGFRILALKGVADESVWPYDIEKFAVNPGPSYDVPAFDSRSTLGVCYHPISSFGSQLIHDVECALTLGMGVVFGCTVSEKFCSTMPSGTVEAPGPTDVIAGGHCLCVVGFDHDKQRLTIKNSWSDLWRDPAAPPGCCFMSYRYFLDPEYGASDIWVVSTIPKGLAL